MSAELPGCLQINRRGDPGSSFDDPLLSLDAEIRAISEVDGTTSLKALTIFETRDLIRDCLASWLAAACPEFETVAVADTGCRHGEAAIVRAAAVILGVKDGAANDALIADELAVVRGVRAEVPIVLIGDPDMRAAETLLGKFNLQGYIPTTSTSEIAAAALRLIAAGGTYIPYLRGQEMAKKAGLSPGLPFITSEAEALLTSREQTVLQCLRRGLPNKLIAHELDISIGTVKLHVHNIIAKLKVHNRTEAALAPQRGSADAKVECSAP